MPSLNSIPFKLENMKQFLVDHITKKNVITFSLGGTLSYKWNACFLGTI